MSSLFAAGEAGRLTVLQKEAPFVPEGVLQKYAEGVVGQAFDSLKVLERTTVHDWGSYGMPKGHAKRAQNPRGSGSGNSSGSSATAESAESSA